MNAQVLIQSFDYTAEVIRDQLDDVSHKESLVQFGDDGHSINWLLGHIVSARSVPLYHVGAEPVWTDEIRARYRNGSLPIGKDEAGVLPLFELIELFNLTQDHIIAGLQHMTEEQLSEVNEYAHNTVFASLLYFHFHETYHTGQLTMVAQHIGKEIAYRK